MAAIVVPSPRPRSRPAGGPLRPGRPHLIVLPGGSLAVLRQRIDAHRRELTFWRRRVVALVAAVFALWMLAQVVAGGVGWLRATLADASAPSLATTAPAASAGVPPAAVVRPAPGAPGALPSAVPAGTVYVVESGDTLWSIAAALRPESDTREVVAALKARARGAVLQPGQRIDVVDLP